MAHPPLRTEDRGHEVRIPCLPLQKTHGQAWGALETLHGIGRASFEISSGLLFTGERSKSVHLAQNARSERTGTDSHLRQDHLREFQSVESGGALDSRSSSSSWRSFVASAGSVPGATEVFSKKYRQPSW